MKHRWSALAGVLALGALVPGDLAAQGSVPDTPRSPATASSPLGRNYPNPFNPETTIPFTIGDAPACTEGGREYRVSLRIYNVLAQLVAVPVLQGGPRPGEPVQALQLPCGHYTAFWDGKLLETGQEVASGVYLYRLEIDGKSFVKKMLVRK